MKLKLMDYMDRTKEFDIGNFNCILRIDIRIVSGDEIAVVTYMNGDKTEFDSCDTRTENFYDGEYCLYNRYEGNRFEEFSKRETSYDILEGEL